MQLKCSNGHDLTMALNATLFEDGEAPLLAGVTTVWCEICDDYIFVEYSLNASVESAALIDVECLGEVDEITHKSPACPSTWEGKLIDGREFSIRFRYGELRLAIDDSEDKWQLRPIFTKSVGDEWAGVMSTDEMKKHVRHLLDFMNLDYCQWPQNMFDNTD